MKRHSSFSPFLCYANFILKEKRVFFFLFTICPSVTGHSLDETVLSVVVKKFTQIGKNFKVSSRHVGRSGLGQDINIR